MVADGEGLPFRADVFDTVYSFGVIHHTDHPVLGPLNIYQWVLFNGSHEARHTLQVREIGSALNSAAAASS